MSARAQKEMAKPPSSQAIHTLEPKETQVKGYLEG